MRVFIHANEFSAGIDMAVVLSSNFAVSSSFSGKALPESRRCETIIHQIVVLVFPECRALGPPETAHSLRAMRFFGGQAGHTGRGGFWA